MLENILSQSCLVFWNIRVTETRSLIKQKNGTKLKFFKKFFPLVIINCILATFHNVRPHKATYRRWVMMAHISWWTKLKGLVAHQGSNITPFHNKFTYIIASRSKNHYHHQIARIQESFKNVYIYIPKIALISELLKVYLNNSCTY